MKKFCFLLLVTILLPGCAASPVAIAPTPSVIPTVVVSAIMPEPTDLTQILEVKTGQTFDIVLLTSLSTGYRWQIIGTPNTRLIQYISSDYIPQQPRMPGSLGVEMWTFHALAPGDVDIQFGYFPPNLRHPDDTAVFSISIE
jgi:predicted secreted protein